MLILLSSGARRRYRDDIVRALAHPEGTEFRFRYGKAHVEAGLLPYSARKALKGKDALICHLVAHPDGNSVLVPCRFASVARAELVGSSLVLALRAGAYVQQLDNQSLRAQMSAEERPLLPGQSHGINASPNLFAFGIAAPLTATHAPTNASADAFEATVEALVAAGFGGTALQAPGKVDPDPSRADTPSHNAEPPSAPAFYMVRKLVTLGGKLGADETPIAASDGRYRLKCGVRYAIDVYTYASSAGLNPAEASTLTISADDGDVKFSSGTEAVLDSRYDLNRFRFSAEQRLTALSTGLTLALAIPTQRDGKTVVEKSCDITLELAFSGSKWLGAARIALISVGTAAPAIIGAYAAQKGSIGLALVMIAAALATGIGTVLPAFKKS